MEGIDEIVMEMESESEVVTRRGVLQQIKTPRLYLNERVTISIECRRESVIMHWYIRWST